MAKQVIFKSISNKPAEWAFYPNAKIRKSYPDTDLEFLGMECQEGEMLSLNPKSKKMLNDTLVIEVAEGRVELFNFVKTWGEGELDEDAIVWDVDLMIQSWASDD